MSKHHRRHDAVNKLLQGMLNNAHTKVMLEIAADEAHRATVRRDNSRDLYERACRIFQSDDEALRVLTDLRRAKESTEKASATSTPARDQWAGKGGGNG